MNQYYMFYNVCFNISASQVNPHYMYWVLIVLSQLLLIML